MIKATIGTLVITSMIATTTLRADIQGEQGRNDPTVYEEFSTEDPVELTEEEEAGYPEYSEEQVLEQQDVNQTIEQSDLEEWEENPPEEAPSKVGKLTNEGFTPQQKKIFYNTLLAVGAIIVAVVAICLASSNNGHKKDCKN